MKTESIGLAMIAQNESAHIPPSLAQFFAVVDDIVVVDGGSTDGTVSWAKKMGARVLERPFDKDFSAQKNFAIENLDTDWVYLHDPDERLEPTVLDILPFLTTREGQVFLSQLKIVPESAELYDCFGIARRNYIDGIQTGIYPDYQYRFFKNYCRFELPVHEHIINFEKRTEIDPERDDLENPSRFNILHYKSTAKQIQQNDLYKEIEEREGL